jgi:hypothetical protein
MAVRQAQHQLKPVCQGHSPIARPPATLRQLKRRATRRGTALGLKYGAAAGLLFGVGWLGLLPLLMPGASPTVAGTVVSVVLGAVFGGFGGAAAGAIASRCRSLVGWGTAGFAGGFLPCGLLLMALGFMMRGYWGFLKDPHTLLWAASPGIMGASAAITFGRAVQKGGARLPGGAEIAGLVADLRIEERRLSEAELVPAGLPPGRGNEPAAVR